MITLSEYAYAKLNWFRTNCNENNICNLSAKNPSFLEVSLMGISHSEEFLSYIVDFVCVPQEASSGLTEPTDKGMADYLESMYLDHEILPLLCGRFWAHTHPGISPTPSQTDWETFQKWFADSDYGVMYILADGDDSCNVKHATKYFGNTRESMPVYVALDRKDDKDNQITLCTKTIFSIDKLGQSDGYGKQFPITNAMFTDYSDKHEEWMEELKTNVKKKYIHTSTPPYYQQQTQNQTRAQVNQEIIKGSYNPEKKTTNTEGSSATTGVIKYTNGFTSAKVIELLIKNNKETVNSFGKEGMQAICNHFKITLDDLQRAYNVIKTFENTIDVVELIPFENMVIDINGESMFERLTQNELLLICTELLIRPKCLKELIQTHIRKAHFRA
jgi:hypothetical protein